MDSSKEGCDEAEEREGRVERARLEHERGLAAAQQLGVRAAQAVRRVERALGTVRAAVRHIPQRSLFVLEHDLAVATAVATVLVTTVCIQKGEREVFRSNTCE